MVGVVRWRVGFGVRHRRFSLTLSLRTIAVTITQTPIQTPTLLTRNPRPTRLTSSSRLFHTPSMIMAEVMIKAPTMVLRLMPSSGTNMTWNAKANTMPDWRMRLPLADFEFCMPIVMHTWLEKPRKPHAASMRTWDTRECMQAWRVRVRDAPEVAGRNKSRIAGRDTGTRGGSGGGSGVGCRRGSRYLGPCRAEQLVASRKECR